MIGRWVRMLAASVVGNSAPMPARLLERFPELSSVRLRRGGLLVRVAGWLIGHRTAAGITLWRTVIVAPDERPSAGLLLHELRHLQQFQEDRLFPLRYLLETLRRGYTNNRYERDAVRFARERLTVSGGEHDLHDIGHF